MQIICSYCENKIGEYDHPVNGEIINRKTLKKEKMPKICSGNKKTLGPPVELEGVDPTIYEVRMKKIVSCNAILSTFLVKNGKIYGI